MPDIPKRLPAFKSGPDSNVQHDAQIIIQYDPQYNTHYDIQYDPHRRNSAKSEIYKHSVETLIASQWNHKELLVKQL